MKYLAGLLLLFFHIQVNGQGNKEFIDWSSTRLDWNDFNGTVPTNTRAEAMTFSGIYFSSARGDSVLYVTAICQFDKTQSWVKLVSKQPEVLTHEQLHFDITELQARLLRKFLSEQVFTEKTNLKILPNRYYNDFMQKVRIMQTDYDSQTANGTNTEAQKAWENMIHKELQKLDSYTNTELVLKITK